MSHPETNNVIDDLKRNQKNIVWPQTMENASKADEFLWKGSKNPTLIQRAGAFVFGIAFIFLSLIFADIVRRKSWIEYLILALAFLLLGARFLWSAFFIQQSPNKNVKH